MKTRSVIKNILLVIGSFGLAEISFAASDDPFNLQCKIEARGVRPVTLYMNSAGINWNSGYTVLTSKFKLNNQEYSFEAHGVVYSDSVIIREDEVVFEGGKAEIDFVLIPKGKNYSFSAESGEVAIGENANYLSVVASVNTSVQLRASRQTLVVACQIAR